MKTRFKPHPSRGNFLRLAPWLVAAVLALPAFSSLTVRAQTNAIPGPSTGNDATQSRQPQAYEQAAAKIRADSIQGRRTICGKILKVLPDGIVVESGYPGLMRPSVGRSWLLPGTIQAPREPNLVEGKEPGCLAVGLVFLTDFPRSRSAKPKPYDYVVIEAYPAGDYTYTSVGTLQRTVRHFAASLPAAITVNCDAAGIKPPAP